MNAPRMLSLTAFMVSLIIILFAMTQASGLAVNPPLQREASVCFDASSAPGCDAVFDGEALLIQARVD